MRKTWKRLEEGRRQGGGGHSYITAHSASVLSLKREDEKQEIIFMRIMEDEKAERRPKNAPKGHCRGRAERKKISAKARNLKKVQEKKKWANERSHSCSNGAHESTPRGEENKKGQREGRGGRMGHKKRERRTKTS